MKALTEQEKRLVSRLVWCARKAHHNSMRVAGTSLASWDRGQRDAFMQAACMVKGDYCLKRVLSRKMRI